MIQLAVDNDSVVIPKQNLGIVIYSPFNLNSVLGAVITKIAMFQKGYNVEVIPYIRHSVPKIIKADLAVEIHMVGVDYEPMALIDLIDKKTPKCKMSMFTFSNSTRYDKKVTKRLIEAGVEQEDFFESKHEHAIRDDPHPCPSFCGKLLTKITSEYTESIEDFFASIFEMKAPLLFDFAMVVHKFVTFKPLDVKELSFIYVNLNNLYTALQGSVSDFNLSYPLGYDAELADYTKQLQNVKEVIDTCAILDYYKLGGGTFTAPTLCIGTNDAMLAVRVISTSHEDVVTYTDIRGYRLYRIYTEERIEAYVNKFKPRDIWSEGSVIFMRCDQPKYPN
jgi:hypothetical protein